MIFLYVTAKDKAEAKKIAQHLLEKKLIGCANIFPITAMYQEEGIKEEPEAVLILKTTKEKGKAAKAEIEKIHSYKLPLIAEIPAEPNDTYRKWLSEQVS